MNLESDNFLNHLLKTREEIDHFLSSLSINSYRVNYTIEEDLSVTVHDDLYMASQNLSYIPILINSVQGDFDISKNNLLSLEGSPKKVKGRFNAKKNQLKSLEFCPQSVGEDIIISHNKLTSLEGLPDFCSGFLHCQNNQLTNLKGLSSYIHQSLDASDNEIMTLDIPMCKIGGFINLANNPLETLKGFNFMYTDGSPFCSTLRLSNEKKEVEGFVQQYDKEGALRIGIDDIQRVLNILNSKDNLEDKLKEKITIAMRKI